MNQYLALKDFTVSLERIKLALVRLEHILAQSYSQREEIVRFARVDSFATRWLC